ncbi:MAG: ParA family protein, partial [Sphingobacteriales bacterium]
MFIISLYHLKGGVGKTASCVNLAYLAARDGFRALVWDLDPQGAAAFYLGAAPLKKGSTRQILEGELRLKKTISRTSYKNLDIVSSDISSRWTEKVLAGEDGSKRLLDRLLRKLKGYDFIFVDCPPGFSSLADSIFFASDILLMPVVPTTLSIRAYESVAAYLLSKEAYRNKLMCFFSMADTARPLHSALMAEHIGDGVFFQHYIPSLPEIEDMGGNGLPAAAPSG